MVKPCSCLGEDPRGCRSSRAKVFEVGHLCASTRTALVSSCAEKPQFHSSLCEVCLLET